MKVSVSFFTILLLSMFGMFALARPIERTMPARLGASKGGKSTESDKFSWPELVGKSVKDAVSVLDKEAPADVKIFVMQEDAMMTADYRLDRIRVMVKGKPGKEKVSKPPHLG